MGDHETLKYQISSMLQAPRSEAIVPQVQQSVATQTAAHTLHVTEHKTFCNCTLLGIELERAVLATGRRESKVGYKLQVTKFIDWALLKTKRNSTSDATLAMKQMFCSET